MRSVRFHEFGDPLSVLRIETVALPELRSDQVLVRLSARPINPSDLLIVRGLYGILPELPATPGLEGMGEVVAVGADVRDLRQGQRVISFRGTGTWQELAVFPAHHLISVPDAVTDQSAAQFMVNPLSAWLMIVDELAMQRGEWLVQTAAGSTLGRIVLQLARINGFKTINIVRSREHIEDLIALGADEVICSDDTNVEMRIREIVGESRVTKAIDAVGGETGASVLRALAPGGTMIVYGALSMKPTPMDGGRMIFSTTSVRGFWLHRWRGTASPEKIRTTIGKVLDAMASGQIVPPVEAEYALQDFSAAIRHAKQPGRRGKVLLVS